MLDKSKWPLCLSTGLFSLPYSLLYFLQKSGGELLIFSVFMTICSAYGWFKSLSRESCGGFFNTLSESSFKFGFILFLFSEAVFFISFFWSYFHFMFLVSPDIQGAVWPPFNIGGAKFNSLAFLNTIFLLASGYTLTNGHMFFYKNSCMFGLNLYVTLLLGLSFICTQILEYKFLAFLWSDSIYGGVFYIATGFHGVHVCFGLIFLFLIFLSKTILKFLIFELAAWYWHFVDVVWLFLFIFLYWLNSW